MALRGFSPYIPGMRTMLLSLTLCVAASFAAAKELSLNEISNIMNRIGKAEAPFTQYNADGSRSKGKLYINRPGRMRFEYEGKGDLLVVAGGGNVAIFDGQHRMRALQLLLEEADDLDVEILGALSRGCGMGPTGCSGGVPGGEATGRH